jgi:two-component system chemotaxis response regulator CheB
MNTEPLRVLIVDDSRIFRGVIEEALAGRHELQVVGSVRNGEKAIEFARSSPPDFVTLDIEMPGMGGIATLKALRELTRGKPHAIGVLLVSSYTHRGAALTIEGLQEGAFDFIAKPEGPDLQVNAAALRQQLLAKIGAFLSRRTIEPTVKTPAVRAISATRRSTRFRAVVIGASTGGPDALLRLLPILAPACPVPMFLVQHLPPDFTHYFASNLARRCTARVVQARDGMPVEPGVLYVADGGKHLLVHQHDGNVTTGLSDSPPENGCRPAADVLFRSAAVAYAGRVLAVVLTGMGCDGAKGATTLKRAGGRVIVQDEATSVVWGMPGSVVSARAADDVLPIDEIAPALLSQLGIGD